MPRFLVWPQVFQPAVDSFLFLAPAEYTFPESALPRANKNAPGFPGAFLPLRSSFNYAASSSSLGSGIVDGGSLVGKESAKVLS